MSSVLTSLPDLPVQQLVLFPIIMLVVSVFGNNLQTEIKASTYKR
jgi:hypothetical protein